MFPPPPSPPLQACASVEECQQLKQRYKVGQAVAATVLSVDSRRHSLDVSLLPCAAATSAAKAPAPGTLLLGRVAAVGGGGVRVALGGHSGGRVALTDIHDVPVEDALAGLKAGQYCRAAVLGPDPSAAAAGSAGGGKGKKGGGRGGKCGEPAQLLLSLRPSAGGQCEAHSAAAAVQVGGDAPAVADGPLEAGQLKPGQQVGAARGGGGGGGGRGGAGGGRRRSCRGSVHDWLATQRVSCHLPLLCC